MDSCGMVGKDWTVGEWEEGTDGCGIVGRGGWLGKMGGGNEWVWNGRKRWMVVERGREWIVMEWDGWLGIVGREWLFVLRNGGREWMVVEW